MPKVVVVAYWSGRLRVLSLQSHSSSGFSQTDYRIKLELVAYESGRKESFDCKKHSSIGGTGYSGFFWGNLIKVGGIN